MPIYEIEDPKTKTVYEMDAPTRPSGAQIEAALIKFRERQPATPPPTRGYMDTLASMSDPAMVEGIREGEAQAGRDLAVGVASSVPFVGPETPNSAMGMLGRGTGELAQAAVPVGGAYKAARAVLPNAVRSGKKFQEVMAVAQHVPVEISEPGNAALRILQLSERGGTMPKVVRDFLRRVTDPEKGPLVYEEARDFYQNITRLSADEFKRLTPVMKREIGNLRVHLNHAIERAAATVDKADTYRSAMKEFRRASQLREAWETTKKTALKYAFPAGLAYWAADKAAELWSDR